MKNTISHNQKAEEMRDAYNRSAEYYDSRYRNIQYLKFGITLQKLIDVTKQTEIVLNGPILDMGGGTGLFFDFLRDFSQYLQEEYSNVEGLHLIFEFSHFLIRTNLQANPSELILPPVVICDISYEMLRNSKKDHKIYGLVACDGSQLPFRDSQFSRITTFTVLQNMVHKELAIYEAYRVLQERGIFIISNLEKSQDKREIIESLGKYFDRIHPILYQEQLEKFQKMNVQNSKYSPFHDLEKVEDFFLTAKKTLGRQNETLRV
jgi:ubiquinone/menaquinone biosynthesis C-methylase UbiE